MRVDEQLCQVGDGLLQEPDLVHVLVAQAAQPVGGGEDAGMLSAVRVRAVLTPSSTCQGGNRPVVVRLDRVPGVPGFSKSEHTCCRWRRSAKGRSMGKVELCPDSHTGDGKPKKINVCDLN